MNILPLDIIPIIQKNLDYKELCRCTCLNKLWKEHTENSNQWLYLYGKAHYNTFERPIHLPIHIAVNFFKKCVFIEKEKNETGQVIAELIKAEIRKITLGDRLFMRINLIDSIGETDSINLHLILQNRIPPDYRNNFKSFRLQVNFPIYEEKMPIRDFFDLNKTITLVEKVFLEELHVNIKTGLRSLPNEMLILSTIQDELRFMKAAAKKQICIKGAILFSVLLFYQALFINFFIFSRFSSRKYE